MGNKGLISFRDRHQSLSNRGFNQSVKTAPSQCAVTFTSTLHPKESRSKGQKINTHIPQTSDALQGSVLKMLSGKAVAPGVYVFVCECVCGHWDIKREHATHVRYAALSANGSRGHRG